MGSMSRFRPAMSAPRRPTNATSPPSAAIQAAMLAPEPPPCIVTLAGVSLPRASGSVAWATASVIRSPMTTTRAILSITSSPGRRSYYGSGGGLGWPARPADITAGWPRNAPPPRYCHRTVIRLCSSPASLLFPQREHAAGHDQFGLLGFGRQRLVQPPELVPEQPPGWCRGHHPKPRLVADRHHVGAGLPPGAEQFRDPPRQLLPLRGGLLPPLLPGAALVP